MENRDNELYLWCTNVHPLTPPEAECVLALLSDAERIRYGKLSDAVRRDEFLITRHLLRTALSRHLSLKPDELRFSSNRFGKPSLSQSSGLEFNLSNTSRLAVCLVSFSGPVGVDIEQLSRAADVLEVAELCFSRKEMQHLFSCAPSLRPDRALTLWTLKEAYLKAIGIGLHAGLGKIEFLYDAAGEPRLRVENGIDARPDRWHFYTTDIMNHRIALMARFPFRRRMRIVDTTPSARRHDVWNILQHEVPINTEESADIHDPAAVR